MSCHVITGRTTSTGYSVMQFTSWSRQPSFANDVTGTMHFNRITDERN